MDGVFLRPFKSCQPNCALLFYRQTILYSLMTMYPCNRSIIEVLLLHVSFMMLDHAQATTATAMSIAPNPVQQKDQLNMIECIVVETKTTKMLCILC